MSHEPTTGPDALRMEVASVQAVHLVAVGTLDGVAIAHVAARNGPGTGYLAADSTGSGLKWKAPGSSAYGETVDCSPGGGFVLPDGDDPEKFVRVAVIASRLPAGADAAQVLLRDVYDNAVSHDDVSADAPTSLGIEARPLQSEVYLQAIRGRANAHLPERGMPANPAHDDPLWFGGACRRRSDLRAWTQLFGS